MEEVVYSTDELTRNLHKLERISMLGYNWDGLS